MFRVQGLYRCLFMSGLLVVAVGCGNRSTTVKGKVMLDNQPLSEADVVFFPDSGGPGNDIVGCKTSSEGDFQLVTTKASGVAPGKYRVVVTKYVNKDGTAIPSEEAKMRKIEGKVKSATPPTYGTPEKTPLRAEVTPGENTVELTLTTSGKSKS